MTACPPALEILARSTKLADARDDLPAIWLVAPEDLAPDPHNPMEHSDAEIARLTHSIATWGFLEPVVWNCRTAQLVGGHGRVESALLAHRGRIHALVIDADPDDQAAINLALNGTGYGHFADDALAAVVQDLAAKSYDLDALGIEPWKVDALLQPSAGDANAGRASAEADAVPESAPPITTPGDLWLLGSQHRVLCGDATKQADVLRALDGQPADLLFTDPPYGVNYEGGHFHSGDVTIQRKRDALCGDADTAIYAAFLPAVLPHVDGPCYLWFAGTRGAAVYGALEAVHAEISALIIWHKTNATYAAMNAQYKQRHECCLYFKRPGSTLRWCGPTDECTVWEIARDPRNDLHPTQKPVALAARALANHDAHRVLDPFAGSGSTLIAAHDAGRRAALIEIEPRYTDIICARFQAYTGVAPILEATGAPHDFLAQPAEVSP